MSRKPLKQRAMDGMSRTDNEMLEVISSMLGLTLGDANDGIWYIQDTGLKKANRCYIDSNNMKLYKCIQATSSTSNTTSNFTELNLMNHSDRLDNLHKRGTSYGKKHGVWYKIATIKSSGHTPRTTQCMVNISSHHGSCVVTIQLFILSLHASRPSVFAMSGEYADIPNILIESNPNVSNGEFNLYLMHNGYDVGDEWISHIYVVPLAAGTIELQTYDGIESNPDISRRESLYLTKDNIFHNNISYTKSDESVV